MKDNGVTIGFAGIEKYEIILYISAVFEKLGKKVLISDCSQNGALDESICYVREECNGGIISYQGIDYISNLAAEKEFSYEAVSERGEQYNFTLIDFGFTLTKENLKRCNYFFIVTDMQKHNVRRAGVIADMLDMPYCIIMKELAGHRKLGEYLSEEIQNRTKAEKVYMLYEDRYDEEYRLKCQYNSAIRFNGLSKKFKDMLIEIVCRFDKQDSEKQILKALKRAEKGR